jgi:PAS domain S-box-containing protein
MDNSCESLLKEVDDLRQQVAELEARLLAQDQLIPHYEIVVNLIDNLPDDHVFAKDHEGRYIFNNAAHVRCLGAQSRQDVLGKTAADFYSSEEAALIWAEDAEIMASGQSIINRLDDCFQPGGQDGWFLISKIPIRDGQGNPIGILGVGHDVTNLKRTEAALHTSEERYRVISEIVSDYAYSFRFKPDGTVELEWITQAFQHITGYDPQVVERDGNWEVLRHPDDVPLGQQRMANLLAGKSDDTESRIITKDGEVRLIRDTRRSVWDADQNRAVRFYGVARDITDYKLAKQHELEAAQEIAAIA